MASVKSDKGQQGERLILIIGASGYIGGRLLPLLEAAGERIRCTARNPAYLQPRVGQGTEVVYADVLDPYSIQAALHGVHTAYYFVNSLGTGKDFEELDRCAARNFSEAALRSGVKKIVYLGGLARGENLSSYLTSQHEVGRIFRTSGVPTVEFRVSIVIGSGSLSFEMVKGVVERLPVMITPRWVRSLAQPIAVEDVLDYLMQALELPVTESVVYEIGGADQVSYNEIMQEYARQRGLRRIIIIPVPVLSPFLSNLWLALITPLYTRVGRKLIEEVWSDSTVEDTRALEVFSITPRGLTEAISRAMINEDRDMATTHWSDALAGSADGHRWWGISYGTRRVDSYHRILCYTPEEVFAPIQCIGGEKGWYGFNWMWKIRGAMDRLIGGVGIRRGRRDPCNIRAGDAIDFWRVEKYVENTLLLLFAEMKTPGRAWLYFEVGPNEKGTEVRMTAVFDPMGVWGRIYWYMFQPFHFLIFNSMFKGIVRAIEQNKKECEV
jgi:uncharacterized protein YbjT (DUF2867 family)